MNDEPLASKYRPNTLSAFIGQAHLVGQNAPIRRFIELGSIPSMIFWGPPGTGKTTLAYIISQDLRYDFYKLQAVSAGKKRLMEVMKIAIQNREYNKKTILFIDEIHRWNKAQQDALLPYVEKGIITLIGATTENPSFSINSALLSRAKVYVFKQHSEEEIGSCIKEVIKKDFSHIKVPLKTIQTIANLSNGDLRSAYNILEISTALMSADKATEFEESTKNPKPSKKQPPIMSPEHILASIDKSIYYDKDGEEHYNIISALHKSLRSSNPDAAAYWAIRMLYAGEDPLYLARRLLRFASEDIGMADSNATILANAVFDACHKLGMPECEVHIVHLVQYLAKSPKNNSAYIAAIKIREDIEAYGNLQVPLHLRNAPTKLMKSLGYSKGYEYDHDLDTKKSKQECMPDKLKGKKYFKD